MVSIKVGNEKKKTYLFRMFTEKYVVCIIDLPIVLIKNSMRRFDRG